MARLVRSVAALCLAAACAAPEPETVRDLGPRSCATCHVGVASDWAASAHAASAASPVFRALTEQAEEAWGAPARDRCVRCHEAPVAGLRAGEEPTLEPLGHVGCITCHAAVGNRGAHDGRLVHSLDQPPASTPGASGPHRLRPTELLGDDVLCGTCHEVTGPERFIEPTFTQHRDSGGSERCVDCHMERGSHRFVGFDPPYALAARIGEGDDVARAEWDRRAQETRALLARALSLSVVRDGDAVIVALENVGASHHVPTGASFLRDVWVDVEIGGDSLARVLTLGDIPTRGGQPVALPTAADAIEHHALPFGERVEVRVPVPDERTVSATLRGRAVRRSVLGALGLPPELVPTHEVATETLPGE